MRDTAAFQNLCAELMFISFKNYTCKRKCSFDYTIDAKFLINYIYFISFYLFSHHQHPYSTS